MKWCSIALNALSELYHWGEEKEEERFEVLVQSQRLNSDERNNSQFSIIDSFYESGGNSNAI